MEVTFMRRFSILGIAALGSALMLSGAGGTLAHNGRHIAYQAATAQTGKKASHKGGIGFISCGGAVLGQIAVPRAGASLTGRGPSLRAVITDSAEGQLAFLRGQAVSRADLAGTPFTRAAGVMAQSTDPALHSCDYLLSDRPDAQPLIHSAIQAAAHNGLVPSAADLRGELQMAMISDNPLRSGSLIVTLLIPGSRQPPPAAGAPPVRTLQAIIAVMDRAGRSVTGISKGNW